MTKYKPVKGRSIKDVKVEDLICSYGDFTRPWLVVGVNEGVVWSRRPDSDVGCLETPEDLIKGGTQIVELIPEPKIEVTSQLIDIWTTTEANSKESCVVRVTRTDGKITAIELIKHSSFP